MINILNKRLLISSSTQTNVRNKKSLRNRVTSCTNIKLKLDPSPSNNQFNNRIMSSHFKGKKLSKKKKKLDLYNNLYSNNNKLTEKDDFSLRIKNTKHKNGKFTLLFAGYQPNNKPVINEYKLNILRKISMNNNINNDIIFDNKEIKKRLIKLPIYNVKTLLNKKNFLLNGLSNNIKTCENNNMQRLYEVVKINYKDKLTKENFPIILNKKKNMNSCTDIKKGNNNIINNIFKRKLFNNNAGVEIQYSKNYNYNGKQNKMPNCLSYENRNTIKKNEEFHTNAVTRNPTEINLFKYKVNKNIKLL
jgi:hypothetical protein